MAHWMRHSADLPAFGGIGPDDTVVDVGCGSGEVCVAAGMTGAEVIGIDIDPKLVPHLYQRMKDVPARSFRAMASNCDPIPIADGIASHVICTEVMEHVDNPARFAAELNRIGKPGATYFISVPDPVSETMMKSLVEPSYFQRPNHQRVYAREEFDALLKAAGLDPVDRPRSPNNFYWAFWCLLRWSGTPDGNPAPGYLPPSIYQWNEVWAALIESPISGPVVEQLDRLMPRSQMVIARKSDRVIDLPRLEAQWDYLAYQGDKPPGSAIPRPHFARRTWRERLKDGTVQLGKAELSWSLRRTKAADGE